MPEIFEIPIDKDDEEPSIIIRSVLEDVELVLRFDWNTRAERWSLSIYDALDNPILLGTVLTIDNEIIERFEIAALPPGFLVLYDTSGKSIEAGLADLGKRCRLFYLSVS